MDTELASTEAGTPVAKNKREHRHAKEGLLNFMSIFTDLNTLDVSGKIRQLGYKKADANGKKPMYLPWSCAWAELSKYDPDFIYEIIRDDNGYLYHNDGRTAWVETSLTIKGRTLSENLPVMGRAGNAIAFDNITSMDVNNALKRCFVKNAALFGLGLNLWEGEELSELALEEKDRKMKEAAEALKESNSKVLALCTEKVEAGVDRNLMYEIIKKFTGGIPNPAKIPTIEMSEMCLEEISKLEVK